MGGWSGSGSVPWSSLEGGARRQAQAASQRTTSELRRPFTCHALPRRICRPGLSMTSRVTTPQSVCAPHPRMPCGTDSHAVIPACPAPQLCPPLHSQYIHSLAIIHSQYNTIHSQDNPVQSVETQRELGQSCRVRAALWSVRLTALRWHGVAGGKLRTSSGDDASGP